MNWPKNSSIASAPASSRTSRTMHGDIRSSPTKSGISFPALEMLERGKPDEDIFAGQVLGRDGATPQVLGDYRLIREVGRGGMAIVYEAEQVSLGRHVAVKVLPAHAARDTTALLRFRREARSAARLHHTATSCLSLKLHTTGEFTSMRCSSSMGRVWMM